VQTADAYNAVELDVFQTSGLVTFEAIGPLGSVLARQILTTSTGKSQRVALRGFRGPIRSVRVISPNASCLVLGVCCERGGL
jgi:hypothetical protein